MLTERTGETDVVVLGSYTLNSLFLVLIYEEGMVMCLLKNTTFFLVGSIIILLIATSSYAKEVTVGYQEICNPWKWKIASGAFERITGYDIRWRKFDSGHALANAVALGDVQIAEIGSSLIAATASRGEDIQVFLVLEDIAEAEALVVRNAANIVSPQDLRGKTIGVPFVSTTHYHLLFALQQFGINPADVDIRNIQMSGIVPAWESRQIDAAFVWDPALGKIKRSGRVLVTSGQLSAWGKPTFDGLVVDVRWGKENASFMVQFVQIIDDANKDYRSNPNSWSPTSVKVMATKELAACNPKNVPAILALFSIPDLKEQASETWLGGGKNSGVAKALYSTSEFLKKQHQINKLQKDYGKFVTNQYVKTAMK